ncbi:hypothetical protein BDZ45DRAFT_490527 [Acephala macrosclerotiorum]|nr:hypothetical protein BDZ45DRAFT_490527 [Acephala macrosclerotiorum]
MASLATTPPPSQQGSSSNSPSPSPTTIQVPVTPPTTPPKPSASAAAAIGDKRKREIEDVNGEEEEFCAAVPETPPSKNSSENTGIEPFPEYGMLMCVYCEESY